MEEKEIIGKIQILRQIKPRKEWVLLAKKEILGEKSDYKENFQKIFEILFFVALQRRFVYTTIIPILILIGIFGFAEKTVPGDFLFPLKKAMEESQKMLVSQEKEIEYNLEIINKRLEDLDKVIQSNRKDNIKPAIKEVEVSLSTTAQKLIKRIPQSVKKTETVKEIALKIEKLNKEKENIKSLGVKFEDSSERDNPLVSLVQEQISQLENSILTKNQKTLLDWAKIDVNNGDYSGALIKILQISNLKNGEVANS